MNNENEKTLKHIFLISTKKGYDLVFDIKEINYNTKRKKNKGISLKTLSFILNNKKIKKENLEEMEKSNYRKSEKSKKTGVTNLVKSRVCLTPKSTHFWMTNGSLASIKISQSASNPYEHWAKDLPNFTTEKVSKKEQFFRYFFGSIIYYLYFKFRKMVEYDVYEILYTNVINIYNRILKGEINVILLDNLQTVEYYLENYKTYQSDFKFMKDMVKFYCQEYAKVDNTYTRLETVKFDRKKEQLKGTYKVLKYYTGYDTEYIDTPEKQHDNDFSYTVDNEIEIMTDSVREKRQKLLSYQFSHMVSDNVFVNDFIYTNGDRHPYNVVIDLVESYYVSLYDFNADSTKKKDRVYFSTTIVAHKNIVDFTKMTKLREDIQSLKIVDIKSINNCLVTTRPVVMSKNIANHKVFCGRVQLRDSLILNNPQSLKELGDSISLEKLNMTDNEIQNMENVINNDFEKYYNYAIRDSQIAVKFLYDYYEMDSNDVPLTVASAGQELFKKEIINFFGWDNKPKKYSISDFDRYFRGLVKIGGVKERNPATKKEHTIMSQLYYGGNNTTFAHGYFNGRETGEIYHDIDGTKCYPTSACLVPFIDMTIPCRYIDENFNVEDFDYDSVEVGYCTVDFEFSDSNTFYNYPNITVKTPDNGLIFPRKGERVTVNIQELKTAYKNGATIKIHNGAIFYPKLNENNEKIYPFKVVFEKLTKLRNEAIKKYGKKSPQEQSIKIKTNSSLGKLGQGATTQKGFDIVKNKMVDIPTSNIENVVYIATITAIARSVIMELINLYARCGYKLYNVVTDGFLVGLEREYTDNQINDFVRAEIAKNPQFYPNTILYIKELESQGITNYLENKFLGQDLVIIKTRMACLGYIGSDDDSRTKISMTGYKGSVEFYSQNKNKSVADILTLLRDRTGRVENESLSLQNARSFRNDTRENSKIIRKQLDFNYDYKRAIDTESIQINSGVFSFFTIPHETPEDFFNVKKIADKNKDMPLKNMETLKKMSIFDKLQDLPVRFRKSDTVQQFILRLLLMFTRKKILYFGDLHVKDWESLQQLDTILGIEKDNDKWNNKYYNKQKITDSQIIECLKRKSVILDILNSYYNTDNFNLKGE